jgi:ABC-type glutathione transport system ATPase component
MPERVQITLEPYEMANMGGDMVALVFHCIIGILIIIIVETGLCFICSRSRARRNAKPKEIDGKKSLIEVEDLRKVYSRTCFKKKDAPKNALEKTSFHVTEHECFSLLGENGAGKSTSFKILTKEIRQSGGIVNLLGLDADRYNSKISKELGYCPQDDVLFDLLTV